MPKFYLEIYKKREGKLKLFASLGTFTMASECNGAPGADMALLGFFLNIGERLSSSKEQFVLFDGAVKENSN